MSAEGQLYNAALFAPSSSSSHPSIADDPDLGLHPPHASLALEYLEIVKFIKTHTNVSGLKGHLFKLMRPGLSKEKDLREKLGKIKLGQGEEIDEYVEVALEMKRRMEVSRSEGYISYELLNVFVNSEMRRRPNLMVVHSSR